MSEAEAKPKVDDGGFLLSEEEAEGLARYVDNLRLLIKDMWRGMCGYGHDCRTCDHVKYNSEKNFLECEFRTRMRGLGIEVD